MSLLNQPGCTSREGERAAKGAHRAEEKRGIAEGVFIAEGPGEKTKGWQCRSKEEKKGRKKKGEELCRGPLLLHLSISKGQRRGRKRTAKRVI